MKPLPCLGFFRHFAVLGLVLAVHSSGFAADQVRAEGFVLNQGYPCEEIGAYTGGAGSTGGSTFTIEKYDAASGKFTGRMNLNVPSRAVSRIEGTIGKGALNFKEVAWIKAPAAKERVLIGGDYKLQLSAGYYVGAWTIGKMSGKVRIKAPDLPPPAKLPSLTGAWVASSDPRAVTPDNKVIIVQEGDQVRLTSAYKVSGKWVTLVAQGTLVGNQLKMQSKWAPGGNPHGYADGTIAVTVSADGNHLDGKEERNGTEVHYSRCP